MKRSSKSWGRSSVGRAPALQAGGQEFESLRLHRSLKLMTASLYLENRILKNLKYQRLIFAKNKDCQDDKTSEILKQTDY